MIIRSAVDKSGTRWVLDTMLGGGYRVYPKTKGTLPNIESNRHLELCKEWNGYLFFTFSMAETALLSLTYNYKPPENMNE